MNKVEKVSDFKTRFKQAIKESGLKQIELSQKAKCTPSQISSYLKGFYEPKRDKLECLSKALNVSELWLLGYDVDKYALEENTVEMNDIRLDARLMMYLDFMSKMSNEDRENIYKYIDFVRHNKQ